MNRNIDPAPLSQRPVAIGPWPLLPLLLLLNSCAYKNKEADLVVRNAHIVTLDSVEHVYSAMAITDGRIVELGAEQQILNRYRAKEVYDAAGQFIYPGFIDGHCHFLGYGLNKQKVDLQGTKSWQEVLARTKAFADAHPEKTWILGRGWDQNDWEVKDLPERTALDKLFPDRPVLLQRVDGHAAVANAAALHHAGITSATQVNGGQITGRYTTPDGDTSWMAAGALKEVRHLNYPMWEPTGLLVDNAFNVFQTIFDEADEATKRKALLDAERDCLAAGLTMVCDAGLDTGTIGLMQRMQEAGELKMRVYAMVADQPENLARFAASGPIITERLVVRSVKVYADGAMGSHGALLKQPYEVPRRNGRPVEHATADDLNTMEPRLGLLLNTRAHFDSIADWCRDHGFQMATHCIGDSANRLLLDVYGRALGGTNDLRWRIEHVQRVDPIDWPLFARYNVIPSMQPTHLQSDGPWVLDLLGSERTAGAYAWHTAMKQSGLIALGTDFPVEPISPIATYYAAVSRTYRDGSEIPWSDPAEALSRMEALRGMTIWNAIASFTENTLGTLEVGKHADFVVLDRDILMVDLSQLPKTKVVATFIAGENLTR